MQIIKYVDLFVGAFINMCLCFHIIRVVFDIEYVSSKSKRIMCIIFSTIAISIINIFNKDLFKIVFTFPFVVIAIKNMFNTNYKKSIFYFITSSVYMFVGELIASIIFSLLPYDYMFIINKILGAVIGNVIVVVFTLPLLKLKKLKSTINKIESRINEKSKIIITAILVLLIGAVAYKNSTGTTNIINIIVNITVTITFISIIYMYYIENIKSQELYKNYNEMFKYLEKYEKELNEKSKIIHDYKNQLIVINGYIGDNDKLREYVNELISEQKSLLENSMIKNIDKLPRGLKGLIYYKFSHVDSDIKVNIEVSNSLKKFDKISSKTSKKVLTIIGVLIDNAIEALEHEKSKYINIELSIYKNIFKMNIINKCSKNINTNRMKDVGYSTKGKNRGYGLSLVDDIIRSDKNIDVILTMLDGEFMSELSLKI